MTNSTTSDTASASKIELWIQQIAFYGFVGGILCTIGNVAMALGIARNKTLCTRFFVILLFLVITRALLCAQWLVMSVYRTLRDLGLADIQLKRVSCLMVHFHGYYAMTLEMVLLLAMVVDRAMAIVTYKYYRRLTTQHAVIGCTVATTVTILVKMVPMFIGVDWTEVVACVSTMSPTPAHFNTLHLNMDLPIALSVLAAHIALLLYVRFCFLPSERAKSQQNGDQAILIEFKRQSHLLRVLGRLVLIHCGFTLLARVMLTISSFIPQEEQMRMWAYIGMLVPLDFLSNIIILLTNNEDIRRATLPCGNKSSTNVTTVTAIKANKKIQVNSLAQQSAIHNTPVG